MRTMKRFIALVMVAMLLVTAAVLSVSATEEADYTDAAKKLASINIMKGDTSGNLMLENGVTRYQAALFFVQALTGETEVSKWNFEKQSAVFADVPEYGTAIDYANGIGLIRGRGDGTYGYNDPIIYQDMLVLAVRALGYETEGMSYPYGYIEAAKKLGLNENLAAGIVNSKELTRGETAQIIWNMLNTYVAEIDPLTDKILYPNDIGATTALGAPIPRITLLEKAEFSQGVIKGDVVEYNEAKLSSDIATVVIDSAEYGEIEIAASELGITSRTYPSTFLGLPVTLYVDCEAEEFDKLYDLEEEYNQAKIIFAETVEFTNVRNIGDEGNIKVVEKNDEYTVTLGTDSFKSAKYDIDFRVLDAEDGWVAGDFYDFVDNFLYDSDEKEYIGANSYGEVDYTVITEKVDDKDVYTLVMLYKPYEFGQYFTRTVRYQPTVSDESFITIGKYEPDAVVFKDGGSVNGDLSFENKDGDYSFFVEYLLGSTEEINSDTTSVSKADGEAARDARLSGESVRAGDFIFYYYNELDNVLVIGYNCGALKEGTLTSYSTSKETVKIAGTTYEYGFEGMFTNNLPVFDNFEFADDFLAYVDKANAQYVAVDDKVLYLQTVLNGSNYRSKHNYVITTSEEEVMAELLGLDVEDYRKKLTDDGVYVSESGNLTFAVLNTSNGKWTLAEVAQFECGQKSNGSIYPQSVSGFVHEDNEFPYTVDIAESIGYYEEFGDKYKNAAEYTAVRDELLNGGLFAVRGKTGNVYNLSAMFTTGDWGMIDNGKVEDGLYFSDTAPKTNKVIATRRSGVEAARVTLTDSTVIVVIDKNDNVGVRVGIQGEENSIKFTNTSDSVPGGFFYSANNKLIVLKFNNSSTPKVYHNDGTAFDVAAWADADANSASETYYVATNDAGVEYEKLDDGTYDVTVSGLFNLRTMRNVSAIKVNMDELDSDVVEGVVPGAVVHMTKSGELEVVAMGYDEALLLATDMRDDKDDDFTEIDMSAVEFVDDCSITMAEFNLDKKTAIGEIKMTVATVDATDIDFDKFDITRVAYEEAYDEENEWDAGSIEYNDDGDKYYWYGVSDLNVTEAVSEPTADILDQFIIDTAGETFTVANNNEEYFDNAESFTVELYACGQFDEDTGVLTVYVLKLLK